MYDENVVPQIAAALTENLTADELQELDDVITPRVAALFAKAFGEQMWDILAPLTEGDEAAAGTPGPSPDSAGAETELRGMMRDPRYWRDRDPAHVARVAGGFRQLYPGEGG
ncbi:MAG: hypothetical protein WD767_20105 [Alphaproteobacteria bacterium]